MLKFNCKLKLKGH